MPFLSPMHESESEVAQSCPTLSDPMDCSLPGSSIHRIFQARVLEWGAIEDLKIIIFLNLKNVNSKNVSRTFSGVVVGSVGSVHFQTVP